MDAADRRRQPRAQVAAVPAAGGVRGRKAAGGRAGGGVRGRQPIAPRRGGSRRLRPWRRAVFRAPRRIPAGPADGRVLLPTAALVTYAMLRRLIARHPVEGVDSLDVLATYDAMMLRLILFLIGVHAIVLVG